MSPAEEGDLALDREQDGPPFAVVVVRTALQRRVTSAVDTSGGDDEDYLTRAFHYSIPAGLRGCLVPGHLVWVPFGSGRAHCRAS